MPLALTKTDGSILVDLREKVEAPFFFSLSFSLCSFPPLSFFLFSSFFFFFSFWSYPTEFFFFLLSLSIISFSFSLFSLHLILIHQMHQKWGKLPPTFLFCHMSSSHFSYFLDFSFSFDTWLNMIHLSKCHVSLATPHDHHTTCPSPKVPSGIHMVMPCVTRHSVPRKT